MSTVALGRHKNNGPDDTNLFSNILTNYKSLLSLDLARS